MIDERYFKPIPLISSLSSATQGMIAERGFLRELQSGETLVIEGMPAEYAYFLISGSVRVIRMRRDGRMQVLARFRPGAPLNIISLLNQKKVNRASIETLTPTALLVLSASDFDYLLSHAPDFSKALLGIFAERIATITDLAAGLSLYSVRARLAKFLIELADKPDAASGWTQDEIAAHIGTVRDVVGRLLREFEAEGLIKRSRQQISLVDREALFEQTELEDR